MAGRVFVFEAMYTPQVHQKRKTWHDGSVKFYESNKKLVILDEDRVVVSKRFWNKEKPPSEGSTIQVERVLVEMGAMINIETPQPVLRSNNSSPKTPRRQLPQPQPQTSYSSPGRDPTLPSRNPHSHIEQSSPRVDLNSEPIVSNTSDQNTLGDSDGGSSPMPIVALAGEADIEDFEPEVTGSRSLTTIKRSPFENMPANPPDQGPWTKEAYLLFAWNPPVLVKAEPSS